MTDPVVRFATGLAQSLMAMFIRRRLGTLYTEAGLKKIRDIEDDLPAGASVRALKAELAVKQLKEVLDRVLAEKYRRLYSLRSVTWAGFAICVTLASALFGLLVTKRSCPDGVSSFFCFGHWLGFALVMLFFLGLLMNSLGFGYKIFYAWRERGSIWKTRTGDSEFILDDLSVCLNRSNQDFIVIDVTVNPMRKESWLGADCDTKYLSEYELVGFNDDSTKLTERQQVKVNREVMEELIVNLLEKEFSKCGDVVFFVLSEYGLASELAVKFLKSRRVVAYDLGAIYGRERRLSIAIEKLQRLRQYKVA